MHQAARRRTSQMVAAMSSTDSASSQPLSIHWNGQNRLAGHDPGAGDQAPRTTVEGCHLREQGGRGIGWPVELQDVDETGNGSHGPVQVCCVGSGVLRLVFEGESGLLVYRHGRVCPLRRGRKDLLGEEPQLEH